MMIAEPATGKKTAQTAVSPLRVAYTIQNVGLDLTQRVGDVVPVRYTLDGLQQAGHTVHVYELAGTQVAHIPNVAQITQKRPSALGLTGQRPFRLLESGVRRLQGALSLPYYAFFDSWRFYDAMRNALPPYDVVHEHNGLFSAATARACRRLGKPYVLTMSADPIFERDLVQKPLTGLHRQTAVRQAAFTYQQADQIICVSTASRQHLIDQWDVAEDKIVVMPNGVDVELFSQPFDAQAVRAEWGLPQTAVVITFVGGFQPWHGLENLVESVAALRQTTPHVRLLLVGDGPHRAALEAKIAACGLTDISTITGLLPQAQVPELLAAADIAVLPYPQFSMDLWFSPLKLYEYMAAGKAIVASRSGQIGEVLENGRSGMLVTPGAVGELTAVLAQVVQDRQLRVRLGQTAQTQAIRQHGWDRYIQRLETIYTTAIHRAQQKQNRSG